MSIKAIVFDFDGTLIDSNQLKYDAYYKLFPSDDFHKRIITEVLGEIFEESRYAILKEIMRRVNSITGNEYELDNRVRELATEYNVIVVDGAKHCKEKPGAKEVLESLSKKYNLYLNSTTPEISLKDIVKHRKWENCFCDIFGYPNDKVSVLLEIIRKENIDPDELLVVGDGKSDRDSADKAGSRFFHVFKDGLLVKLVQDSEKYL
jgi:phosphoglycolate phosphatase-like HAD superfamily hydrolase